MLYSCLIHIVLLIGVGNDALCLDWPRLGSGLIWHDYYNYVRAPDWTEDVYYKSVVQNVAGVTWESPPLTPPPPPPPEIIPYGKRSPLKDAIWQTFPRKKSHGRTSPGGKEYHMVNPPHTNFMMRKQIPWQIVPPPPPEMIPHGKCSHEGIPPGRNPMAELTQGETIPYGKASSSVANLLSHKFHM